MDILDVINGGFNDIQLSSSSFHIDPEEDQKLQKECNKSVLLPSVTTNPSTSPLDPKEEDRLLIEFNKSVLLSSDDAARHSSSFHLDKQEDQESQKEYNKSGHLDLDDNQKLQKEYNKSGHLDPDDNQKLQNEFNVFDWEEEKRLQDELNTSAHLPSSSATQIQHQTMTASFGPSLKEAPSRTFQPATLNSKTNQSFDELANEFIALSSQSKPKKKKNVLEIYMQNNIPHQKGTQNASSLLAVFPTQTSNKPAFSKQPLVVIPKGTVNSQLTQSLNSNSPRSTNVSPKHHVDNSIPTLNTNVTDLQQMGYTDTQKYKSTPTISSHVSPKHMILRQDKYSITMGDSNVIESKRYKDTQEYKSTPNISTDVSPKHTILQQDKYSIPRGDSIVIESKRSEDTQEYKQTLPISTDRAPSGVTLQHLKHDESFIDRLDRTTAHKQKLNPQSGPQKSTNVPPKHTRLSHTHTVKSPHSVEKFTSESVNLNNTTERLSDLQKDPSAPQGTSSNPNVVLPPLQALSMLPPLQALSMSPPIKYRGDAKDIVLCESCKNTRAREALDKLDKVSICTLHNTNQILRVMAHLSYILAVSYYFYIQNLLVG